MPTAQFVFPAPIGTVNFISVGAFEETREEVEIATRSNVAGAALVRSQQHPRPRTYEAIMDVDEPDLANLQTLLEGFQDWVGVTATYYDDLGIVHSVTVIAVEIPPTYRGEPNPVALIVGGSAGGLEGADATHLVAVRLTLVDAS